MVRVAGEIFCWRDVKNMTKKGREGDQLGFVVLTRFLIHYWVWQHFIQEDNRDIIYGTATFKFQLLICRSIFCLSIVI